MQGKLKEASEVVMKIASMATRTLPHAAAQEVRIRVCRTLNHWSIDHLRLGKLGGC